MNLEKKFKALHVPEINNFRTVQQQIESIVFSSQRLIPISNLSLNNLYFLKVATTILLFPCTVAQEENAILWASRKWRRFSKLYNAFN